MTSKICTKCNQEKKLHNFPTYRKTLEKKKRILAVCRACRYGKYSKKRTIPSSSHEFQEYIKTLLEKHVIKNEGCWEWVGSKNKHGYGDIRPNRRHMNSSRAAYIAYKGFIPKGMYILHTCDNRSCCNPDHLWLGTAPDHLWLGTAKDNMQDMVKKGRNKKLKGSECPWATINEDIVLDILDMLKKNINTREIAKKYNIKLSMISDIKTGHRWRHVGDRTGINVIPYKRKLTKFDVIDIKKRIAAGEKLRSIATAYGCAESSIGDIKHGRSWNNVILD